MTRKLKILNFCIYLMWNHYKGRYSPEHKPEHLLWYLRGVMRMSSEEATLAVEEDEIWSFGRVCLRNPQGSETFGACHARRHREDMKRADWYTSAEFDTSDGENSRNVFYGRISKILRYIFRFQSWHSTKSLLFIEWVTQLRTDAVGRLYKRSGLGDVFFNRTIDRPDVAGNAIGVLEHTASGFICTRTFGIFLHRNMEPFRVGSCTGFEEGL